MRRAIARRLGPQHRRPPFRGPNADVRSVPSPVGGWNARDSIDAMAEDEAVNLVNWFPGQGECVLRNGHASHATGLGGTVEALGEFNAGSTRKMFAGANSKLWDVTAAGAATSLKTGFSGNRWQWAQFDDATGGARVGLVNGTDVPQQYNGSAVSAMSISGPGLSGATSSLDGINIFKNRSYFWKTTGQDFWYSATNALGGALSKFPLGRVAGTGGNLICMGTWSRDGGDGPDDLAAFVLSSGDVAVYAGDNPGDAASWGLVGLFKIGAPMGVRSCQKIGGDLVIATRNGYVPMSKVLATREAKNDEALSDKIRKAVLAATRLYSANFGWQVLLYPGANMAIFNVPISATGFEQHVLNTLTGAWCKFQGMNAWTWALYNNSLYFGGSGTVYKADSGRADNAVAITASGQTAWNYLGSRKTSKRFTAMRPLIEADGALQFSAGLGVDFGVIQLQQSESSVAGSTSPWDTSPWDTSPWSDEMAINDNWQSAEGMGYNVSARIDVVTSTRAVKWYSTQYQYEPGRGGF